MITVYTAQSITDAHLIKGFLEHEGIPATVFGGDLQGGIGELPVLGMITVAVPEPLAERAARLIADYECAEPAPDPGRDGR